MAEWLIDAGIGETRAALVEDGTIIEARIGRDDGLAAGAVVAGRVAAILVPRRRAIVVTEAGEALLEPLPPDLPEGGRALFRVMREPIPERGRPRLARLVHAPDADGPAPAPPLATGRAVPPHGPDLLDAAGWAELIEDARTGEIAFPGGRLRISPTPAMTLIDVDGDLDPAALMTAGAAAAARAIRRLDIGGSIGIDLPTVAGKAARQVAAEAVDAMLPQPFERTAVNGFGFLQIVRPRVRPSLVERMRHDAPTSAALELIRRAGRGAGGVTLTAAPAVTAVLAEHPDWLAALERRIGGAATLRTEANRPIWSLDVHRAPR